MFDIHSTTTPAFTIAVDGDDFVFSDLNTECQRDSGIRAEDQLGRRPRECFPAELADRLLAHYRRCAASNVSVTYEMEYVLPCGYAYWRTTLVPFVSPETGRVTTLLGLCVDATAEKMAERASTAFHEKLSLAIGAIDGGFWIYDIASGEFETSRPLAELIAGPGRATRRSASPNTLAIFTRRIWGPACSGRRTIIPATTASSPMMGACAGCGASGARSATRRASRSRWSA